MRDREGNPPIVGACAHCGTNFHSKYQRKTHICKPMLKARRGGGVVAGKGQAR